MWDDRNRQNEQWDGYSSSDTQGAYTAPWESHDSIPEEGDYMPDAPDTNEAHTKKPEEVFTNDTDSAV